MKRGSFPSEKIRLKNFKCILMEILRKVSEMRKISKKILSEKKSIGFVPTMGALHAGHLSLVKKCVEENDVCVVSIFVNPVQFNDKSDLKNYPRTLKKDLALLKKENADFVFVPSVEEIYPAGFDLDVFVPKIAKLFEGKFRKGHFRGVCAVVKRLLELAAPKRAYFGQKDFQQYLVIKKMAEKYGFPVKIVLCPIVREKGGLAMSSRNARLNEAERKSALVLSKSLKLAKKLFSQGEKNPEKIISTMGKLILCEKIFLGKSFPRIDYIEIVDREKLSPVKKISKNCAVLVAVWFGKTRLIDNSFF